MSSKSRRLALFLAGALLIFAAAGRAAEKSKTARNPAKITEHQRPVLWRAPADFRSRYLFYGPGGRNDTPHSVYTFVKEDLDGTNPKFVVRDENGVKWKVKLGKEARPETAAARLVWAAGYFADEDYFVPGIEVDGMPAHLKRGQNLVAPNGSIPNARLKRYLAGEKHVSHWKWRHNPFTGTRELYGLRVMMALINNWDLTDQNN